MVEVLGVGGRIISKGEEASGRLKSRSMRSSAEGIKKLII
jgi:hypothetical protein